MSGGTIEGHCACGKVQVQFTGPAPAPSQCYCSQCRHVSGGGGATFAGVPSDRVRISGKLAEFEEPTRSGNRAVRSFCPACGTAVLSRTPRFPDLLILKLSLFDDYPNPNVASVFWSCEAPPWAIFPQGARIFERGSN